MADRVPCLILIYRVPGEPTRLRATVWRRLKAAGAVYLANSVAALSASPAAECALRGLRNAIGEMGGSAQLLRAEALTGQADVVAAFNAARDEEYMEIINRCRDFLAKIETDTAAGLFTYAELEENGEDLAKLGAWLEKACARDTFGAAQTAPAVSALAKCREALDGFADRVYGEEENARK